MRVSFKLFFSGALLISQTGWAHGPSPVSLQNVPIPPVPGLTDGSSPIVVNKTAAIALGKALFWDTAVGSDGQACASCHFSAGADVRITNQINPGQNHLDSNGQIDAQGDLFNLLPSGKTSGPNYTLTQADFPLFQVDIFGNTTFETDDVVGSAGIFSGQFKGTSQFTGADDQCTRTPDPIYNVNHVGTRQVEPRNAPTVINAVFNHRNFWDGRANNIFNGSSPWGNRDPNAGVWVKNASNTVAKQKLSLINSSLASQAVAPPVFNNIEMGCASRYWPDIGRKLLLRQPLQNQQVHNQDSVLGPYSLSSSGNLKPGLNTTYRNLITKAFNQKYWGYSGLGPFGTPSVGGAPYNQMEANFSMFFGLAVQLYESTLVSDQSPFDLSPVKYASDGMLAPTWSNVPSNASWVTLNGASDTPAAALNRGFTQFVAGHCALCHNGPTLSSAAISTISTLLTPTAGSSYGPSSIPYGPNAFGQNTFAALVVGESQNGNIVQRDSNVYGEYAFGDQGFANTAVTDPSFDPGIAGTDPYGNPLSYSVQYVNYLINNAAGMFDPGVDTVYACDFFTPIAQNISSALPGIFTATSGSTLLADGSREGTSRNQNCLLSNSAYIPSIATAQQNYNSTSSNFALMNQAAFKIPTLRNIELTGPYMHNGGMASLSQVLAFYTNDGNQPVYSNSTHIKLTEVNVGNPADITNFLMSLTDNRVKYQQAPFDHPQITIVNGQVGNSVQAQSGNPLGSNLAQDQYLVLPAVGAGGSTTPLPTFSSLLPQ